MAVDKPGRFFLFNKCSETFKSLVTRIFIVMDVARGGMADDNIKFPGREEVEPFAENGSLHLIFMVLVLSAVIPSRS